MSNYIKRENLSLPEEVIKAYIECGYFREQKVDGEDYLMFTDAYKDKMKEICKKSPTGATEELWDSLCEFEYNSLKSFLIHLIHTHNYLKEATNGEYDFISNLERIL